METSTFSPDIKATWNEKRSPEVLSRFVTRHLAPLDEIEL